MEFTGRLATMGSRILKRKMKSDIDTFFDNIEEEATA
jgi:carbon monoxide dehydrogenase subunit G